MATSKWDKAIIKALSEVPDWWDVRVAPFLIEGPPRDWRPELGPCTVFAAQPASRSGKVSIPVAVGIFLPSGGAPTVFVHRISYIRTHGPLDERLELDHLCRVPKCVRPDHLEPTTHRENLTAPGSQVPGQRHPNCRKCGQPVVGDNVVKWLKANQNGHTCRSCHNAHATRRAATVKRAHTALGLSQSQYTGTYGWGESTAKRVLALLAEGADPTDVAKFLHV